MLFTKVEAQLGPGCSDLPKSQVVHSHQLLSCLAEFPALLFKGFVMQGQKTGQKIHMLREDPFLMLRAV